MKKLLLRLSAIASLLLLMHVPLFSQTADPVQVDILPTKKIYALFFDKEGFMWIGSDVGLSRYDGALVTPVKPYRFTVGIKYITQDAAGRIWCIGNNNNAYTVEKNKLNLIRGRAVSEYISDIMCYKDKVYIATNHQLSVYSTATLTRQDFKIPHERPFGCQLYYSGGSIFIRGFAWKNVLLFRDNKFKEFNLPMGVDSVSDLVQSPDGNILAVPWQDYRVQQNVTIHRCNFVNGKFNMTGQIKWTGSYIRSIAFTGSHTYWINARKESISSDGRKINGYEFYATYKDREGNEWFLSGRGLFVIYKKPEVKALQNIKEDIYSLTLKNNDLFLGGTSKILRYDLNQKAVSKTTFLREWKSEIRFLKYLKGNDFLTESNESCMFYNDVTGTFSSLGGPVYTHNALLAGDIVYIAGKFACTFFHLADPFDADATNVPRWLTKKNCNNCLRSFADVAMNSDKRVLFFATNTQLMEYSLGTIRLLNYQDKPISATALHYFNEQGLYIAAPGLGILLYKNNKVLQLVSQERLGPEEISAIRQVGDRLWLLGSGQVKMLSPVTNTLMANDYTGDYDVTDVVSSPDKAYFLSANKVYQAEIKKRPTVSRPVCRNIFTIINGRDTVFDDRHTFDHDENDFQFNLSSPVFHSATPVTYKYRLKGTSDSAWKYVSNTRGTIRFGALEHGKYIFQAAAIHPAFGESQNSINYQFAIRPPWWDTWIFKLIVCAVLLGLIFISFRLYYRSKLSRQRVFFENQLAIVQERQRISREIHDDIGQSLSVIKLNLGIGTPEQVEEAKSITSEVIKNLRELSHNLYHGKELMTDLISALETDIKKLNLTRSVVVRLEVIGTGSYLTKQKELTVYRIYQEAVNNVLKHAGATAIGIVLEFTPQQFLMTITDNGTGFDTGDHVQGLGIASMKGRLDELGGKLSIESSPGMGTKIVLTLPV